ncbi:alpha/beta hydrolase-fold protein [Lacimicrobium sp. SS2-24]|uniref:alpha/beta hydrolase n=1 Tax=Lacimicrobium sp. SS2-24 TaxID=2005569 RepID=UPI000B4B0FCD|nr:alpha/beta hydrolase-fold protein [Lacimicrobium sp. SS2-24]
MKWLALWILLPAVVQASVSLPGSEMRVVPDAGTGVNYQIAVQLPPDYYQPSAFKTRYPVIYLLGDSTDFALVVGASRRAMQQNTIRPAIIVAFATSSQDMGLGEPRTAIDRTVYHEKLADYDRFLRRQLIPLIEQRYRASSKQRTFIGHGGGALLGFQLVATQPPLFHDLLIASPAFTYDEGKSARLVVEAINSQRLTKARVFIGVGQQETPLYQPEAPDVVSDAIDLRTQVAAWRHPDVSLKLLIVDDADASLALPTTVVQGMRWLSRQ